MAPPFLKGGYEGFKELIGLISYFLNPPRPSFKKEGEKYAGA